MKTIAVLTRMLPTINAVRGSGAFNVVIASNAPKMAEDLRKAANDDRIVAAPLLGALQGLASAADFETQQASMQLVGMLADQMLGDISSGNIEQAHVIPSNINDIVQRIKEHASSMRDVFRPDAAKLRQIRIDASELSALVDAEVREGLRDEGHSILAAQIYDMAERMVDNGYDARQRALQNLAGYAERIAA